MQATGAKAYDASDIHEQTSYQLSGQPSKYMTSARDAETKRRESKR